MTVYVIGTFTVTDENLFNEYQAKAGISAAKYNIIPVAIDKHPEILEGALPGQQIGLLKFASRADVDAWYNSPEYTQARAIRHRSAETPFMLVVEGFSNI
jgi:uncharacterized protein (DUF1330 family)